MSMKAPEDFYPELLRDLADRVTRRLVDTKVCDQPQAQAIGRSVADDLSDAWQGQIVTIPKAAQYKARVRWQEMWEAFNGTNHAELGRTYGMGMKQVYRVLKHMAAFHRSRGPDLFAQAPPQSALQGAAMPAGMAGNQHTVTTTYITQGAEHADQD